MSNANHWVKIQVSWPGNKFGLESKVTVFKAGTKEILGQDEVRTDFCCRSKKLPTLHFGLGSVTSIDVRVTTRDIWHRRMAPWWTPLGRVVLHWS